jgi:hypothetical protein
MCAATLSACGGADAGADRSGSAQESTNALRAQLRSPAFANPTQNASEQLMNWAESQFPQFFPSHQSTQLAVPFAYRYYPEAGIYLGVVVQGSSGMELNSVYVMGGVFGNSPRYVGPLASFITPVITPLTVQPTSQLNAKNLNIPAQQIPTFQVATEYWETATGGIAFADFLQEGQVSLLAATNRFSADPSKPPTAGKLYLFMYVNGEPVDVTGSYLDSTDGCEAPRRIIVADFNGDGRPDAFVSCHGNEWGPVGTWTGEHPRFVLSQPDGHFKNVAADFTCYCHAATAGDVNGDGAVDLIVSDVNAIYRPAASYMLLTNDGTGRFAITQSGNGAWLAPKVDYQDFDRRYYKASFNLELVDVDNDGKLDLFMGNSEDGGNSYIVKGDGTGKFLKVMKSLPTGNVPALSVDASFVAGVLYEFLNTNVGPQGGYEVRRWSADFSTFTVLKSAQLDNGINDPVFLMPYGQTLVPYNARFDLVIDR